MRGFPPTPAADAFRVQRARVRDELEIAFVREGVGGYPLLLVHGYPETKRIWWRNIGPLAAAGFEVIAPDLRGVGDSDLSTSDAYDLVVYSRDLHALVHDVLGHPRCGLVGGDVGGPVIVDMALRFAGFAERLVFFNTVAPTLIDRPELYAQAGLSMDPLPEDLATGDYRIWQGREPERLLAQLDTPERRRAYIAGMYSHRLWAAPGSFSQPDIDFMTEPFADADRLAASWAPYQLGTRRALREPPLLAQEVPVPTLILYGPEDHVLPRDFIRRCEIAFPARTGPLIVPGAGHFLQWERADIFNAIAIAYFRDLT